jgi:DNA-binding SARP family transcriptional activator
MVTPRAPMLGRTLITLLFRANSVITVGELVGELWSDPPKLAKKTVQTYVYQLRKHLGAINPDTGRELIETHQTGYCVRLAPSQLDRWRFERLVAKGEQARAVGEHQSAATAFGRALDLWRGLPVGDLEFGPHLTAELSLLEDRRIEALERRIEADLALGQHRTLVSELKGITARYPTRETFCAQLMVAAQRSGLRADALDAFQRLRRAMVRELGLEPSRSLAQIQREVLECVPMTETSPAPSPPPAPSTRSPAQLPLDTADFVGRKEELGLLRRLCGADPSRTSANVVLVTGRPGVGKTTLAVHLAHRLRADFPGGQLFASLHDGQGRPVPVAEVLTGFLRAFGAPTDELPTGLAELGALFRTWTAGRKLLFVLDDAGSTPDLRHLLPGAPACSVLVTAPGRIPSLPVRETVELEPMSMDEGLRLLTGTVGADRIGSDEAAAREVVKLCDRLPLAIHVAGEKLVARRAWGVRKLSARLTDPNRRVLELSVGSMSVAERFETALSRLGRDEQHALSVLCRLGAGWFDLRAAAKVLGNEPLAIEGLVESLVTANLLLVTGVGHGGGASFRFPDLIRLHCLSHAVVTELKPGASGQHQQLG